MAPKVDSVPRRRSSFPGKSTDQTLVRLLSLVAIHSVLAIGLTARMVDLLSIILICVNVSVWLQQCQALKTCHLHRCFWFAARDRTRLSCSGSWAFAAASHLPPSQPPFWPAANNVTVRSFACQKMVPSHLVCSKMSWHQPSLLQPVAF